MGYNSVGPVLGETVSNVTATNSVELGVRKYVNGVEYVYCYNAGSEQIVPGNGVKLLTAAAGYSMTVSGVTDSCNPCVGVCKNATIATGYYGWIAVQGMQDVVMVSATTADHVPIALGADGKFVQHAPLTDAVHAGTYVVAGYANNANTGAGGTVSAFIKTGF